MHDTIYGTLTIKMMVYRQLEAVGLRASMVTLATYRGLTIDDCKHHLTTFQNHNGDQVNCGRLIVKWQPDTVGMEFEYGAWGKSL